MSPPGSRRSSPSIHVNNLSILRQTKVSVPRFSYFLSAIEQSPPSSRLTTKNADKCAETTTESHYMCQRQRTPRIRPLWKLWRLSLGVGWLVLLWCYKFNNSVNSEENKINKHTKYIFDTFFPWSVLVQKLAKDLCMFSVEVWSCRSTSHRRILINKKYIT
jgi:hypothetical protein